MYMTDTDHRVPFQLFSSSSLIFYLSQNLEEKIRLSLLKCNTSRLCRWRVGMPTANSCSPHLKSGWVPVWSLTVLISRVLERTMSHMCKGSCNECQNQYPGNSLYHSVKWCSFAMHLMVDCCSLYLSFYLHGPSTQPKEEHIQMGHRPFWVSCSCILAVGRLQNAILSYLPTASIQD